MTLRVLAPWVFTTFVALAGFFVTFRQQRSLRLPRYYLAYVAVAAIAQFALWFLWPRQYDSAFWVFEAFQDLLLCALSLEIIRHLLPQQSVKLWLNSALLLMVAGFLTQDTGTTIKSLVSLSISASLTSGTLLMLIPFMRVDWTGEDKMVTAGAVAAMSSSLIPLLIAKRYFGEGVPEVSSFVTMVLSVAQVAPIISLVLLSCAGSFKMQSRRAHA